MGRFERVYSIGMFFFSSLIHSFEAKATRGSYWKGVKANNYIIIVLLRILNEFNKYFEDG